MSGLLYCSRGAAVEEVERRKKEKLMKISVMVFPGQGSQRKGMGEDLFDRYPDLISIADAVVGYSICDLCLHDTDNTLLKTEYTQPALYVVNALSYYAATDNGAQKPDYMAGHSLGEFNALLAAGVFDFGTGLKIVSKRGALMSKAKDGAMAAVIGMEPEKIKEILSESPWNLIDIANYNSPKQTVISGSDEDVEKIIPIIEKSGARMVIKLKVGGAFHSRLMTDAQHEFSTYLDRFQFNSPKIPVISNYAAAPYCSDSLIETLSKQISNPVKWTESIQYLMDLGEVNFNEIGPGNVLTGLIRQIKSNRLVA